jgi:hypothetical protein
VHDRFRARRSHIGVDFYIKETHVGGRRLALHLFHLSTTFTTVSCPRIYCREAVGLVYVYDVTRRDSLNVLPQRHREIVQHFPDGVPPIILGANLSCSFRKASTWLTKRHCVRAGN